MLEVDEMNGVSPWKIGFVDLGAILFVIGGVVSFVMTVLMIPITSIYPFRLPTSFSTVFLVALVIGFLCSLGAIHCYSLTSKRRLSEAGIRGTIFGVLLLIRFSPHRSESANSRSHNTLRSICQGAYE